MRAVVVSGNSRSSRTPQAVWGCLSPLVDRPFLQHLVESIVDRGIREIDFILAEEDEAARALLGDGTRWGAQFRYHSPQRTESSTRCVYSVLEQIAAKQIAVRQKSSELVLVAHSDRLPLLPLNAQALEPGLFCSHDEKPQWTGWGLVRAWDLLGLPQGIDEGDLFTFLARERRCQLLRMDLAPLTALSYEDLIDANRRVLSGEFPGLLIGGREVQPGVWVGRNVIVHPAAKLIPPVFLGENSRLGAMVQAGPRAAIGSDCMIDRETHVSDSLVCRGSYVGPRLVLRRVVVNHSRLVNARWDAEIEGVDELLLGSLIAQPFRAQLLHFCGRAAAALAFLTALPLLVAVYLGSLLRAFPALKKEFVVRTPSVSKSYRWKLFPLWSFGGRQIPGGGSGWLRHFFFCFLPALVAVAFGYMDFTGSRPRTKDEAEHSTPAERANFLQIRPGILEPGLWRNLHFARTSPSDELTDACIQSDARIRNGGRQAPELVMRYAQCVVRNCFLMVVPLRVRRHVE